jgi:hypothetical protein
MMRKGGCEPPFQVRSRMVQQLADKHVRAAHVCTYSQAFMECGSRADKGDHDMVDCLPYVRATGHSSGSEAPDTACWPHKRSNSICMCIHTAA